MRRTDNGNEFQAKFQWDVESKGIRNAYIEASSPKPEGGLPSRSVPG